MYEPSWLGIARQYIGVREVPGPGNNPVILGWLAKLNAKWLGGDSTPWCGSFVAHVMQRAHLPYPKTFFRAKDWSAWGLGVAADRLAPGVVLVFDRQGGGHVGFYVGEDGTHYHVLGGNQSDAVNISRIAKARCVARRWPAEFPFTGKPVRLTAAGVPATTNEA